MQTNTIQLLNNFLKRAHIHQDNFFSINDFNININHDIGIIYPHEEFFLAKKYIPIQYKDLSFYICILSVIEKSTDKLYALSIGCKEINNDDGMIIVEYIHTLIIQFSFFISKQLFDGLKNYARLDKIYLSTCMRLAQKINETSCDEKQYIIDDYQLNSDYCPLNCNLYLTIFLHEDGLLNYLLIFEGDENNA